MLLASASASGEEVAIGALSDFGHGAETVGSRPHDGCGAVGPHNSGGGHGGVGHGRYRRAWGAKQEWLWSAACDAASGTIRLFFVFVFYFLNL